MQSDQAEHLRQLVESSPIMTAGEKADWLDMLILMNDKQAAELEQILTAQHATVAQPAQPASPARPTANVMPAAISPLTHIANLPADLTRSQSAVLPAAPWQKQFRNTMTEKELPAPLPRAPKPGLRPDIATSKTILPTAAAWPANEQPPVRRKSIAPHNEAKVMLETLADAGKLTVSAMRRIDLPDLLIRLQQLSKMEGYFNLLSYLEDSPLYKSYLATGQKVLASTLQFEQAGQTNSQILTKAEFEAFTDILRKIQIN